MLMSSLVPTVMSEGVSSVLTVTFISPNVNAGAWSPPKPCAKTFGIAIGIVKIAMIDTSNVNLEINTNFTLVPYLKMVWDFHSKDYFNKVK